MASVDLVSESDAAIFGSVGVGMLILMIIALILLIACIVVIIKCAKARKTNPTTGNLLGIIFAAFGCFFFGIWCLVSSFIGIIFTSIGNI